MAQKLQNINTGTVIEENLDLSTSEGKAAAQDLADEKGFVPVSSDTPITLPDEVPEPETESEESGVTSSDVFTDRESMDERVQAERERLEQASADRKAMLRGQINRQFAPALEEATQFREDITEATQGKFATKRRLSTAASTFVDFKRGEAQKQINELERRKATAMANLDLAEAERVEKDLATFKEDERFWYQEKRKLEQEQYQRLLDDRNFGLSERGVEIQERREERIRSAEEHEKAFDNLTLLAESGLDSSSFSDEDKKAFEELMQIDSGTFDGIFSSIQEAKQAESIGSEIQLHQSVSTLLNSTPVGTSIMIGDQVYKGRKKDDNVNIITKEDSQGNVTTIGIDKTTGQELYRTSLGRIGKSRKPTGSGASGRKFEFSSGGMNALLGADLTVDDIRAMEANISNGYSLEDIFSADGTELTTEQQSTVRNVFSGKKEEGFDTLDDDAFDTVYIQPYLSEEGFDFNRFSEKQGAEVVLEAHNRGLLEAEDSEEDQTLIEKTVSRMKDGLITFFLK